MFIVVVYPTGGEAAETITADRFAPRRDRHIFEDTTDTMERWHPTHIAPDYAVSDLGNIKRVTTGRVLKRCRLGANKHYAIDLPFHGKFRKFTIAPLMLTAFRGPPPDPRCVAMYLDGDSGNLTMDNLAWAERRQGFKLRPLDKLGRPI